MPPNVFAPDKQVYPGRPGSPRLVRRPSMSENATRLARLYKEFAQQFPDVKPITARQLDQELQGPKGAELIMIDVRTVEEQQVSGLPGRVLSRDDFDSIIYQTARSTPLVTYW